MGTNSATKLIKQVAGVLTEFFAVSTSAGAADVDKIPALNAAGVLDPSIVNAKTVSAGAGDANKIAQLDGTGRLDVSVLPVGVGAETISGVASEALAAGNFVNLWNNAGVLGVRKADASVAGKEANGFVLVAVAATATATVYQLSQTNTQLTGLTAGATHFLSDSAAGTASAAAPTVSGHVVQKLGRASSTTQLVFVPGEPITLA